MVKKTLLWNGVLGHRYSLQLIGVDKVSLCDDKHKISSVYGLTTVTTFHSTKI